MMIDGNEFRRIFFPTPEEEAEDAARLNELVAEAKSRKAERLIPKGPVLLASDPFTHFYGDCEWCRNYLDANSGMTEGGDCLLHKIPCGWGFTCKDFSSNEETRGGEQDAGKHGAVQGMRSQDNVDQDKGRKEYAG